MSILRAIIALAGAATLLSGCGFHPLYATSQGGAHSPLMSRVQITGVEGPEEVAPTVTRALNLQLLATNSTQHDYDLYIEVDDHAQALAVQIDATVTRYNYRLNANYTLFDRVKGGEIKGKVEAIASYNIVSSQYSTLFAERAALEKAATRLAEEVERDILLKLASDES